MLHPLPVRLLAVLVLLSACGDPGGSPDAGRVDAAPRPDAAPVGQGSEPTREIAINEVAARPVSGEDWVEIISRAPPSAEPLDLSGWFVSDSPDRLDHYYQFPAGTTLAPAGYLIVWADDGLPGLPGEHHAPFKLGAADGVFLIDPDGLTVDALLYLAGDDGRSLQRIPNGEGLFWPASATPGTANPETTP